MYRGVLISRDDSFNEEEVAHFFGIYGSIIVSEANIIFLEILNERRDVFMACKKKGKKKSGKGCK